MEFTPFPKMARLSRDVVITEKLDGTNAQVVIKRFEGGDDGVLAFRLATYIKDADTAFDIYAGSRTRWITRQDDNFGFAQWVTNNAPELINALGEGQHFGEWWGRGIQRNYSQTERRFSLFNTHRWGTHFDHQGRVGPCSVVPTLYAGPMEDHGVMKGLQQAINQLKIYGSSAAPGFMKPEGVVIYHRASNSLFKKTLEKDEEPKGLYQQRELPSGRTAYTGHTKALLDSARELSEKRAADLLNEAFPGATKYAEGGR